MTAIYPPTGFDPGHIDDALDVAHAQLVKRGWIAPFGMALGLEDPVLLHAVRRHANALDEVYAGLRQAADAGAEAVYAISEGSALEWPDVLFAVVETRSGGAVRGAARIVWQARPRLILGLPLQPGVVAVDPFSWESIAPRIFTGPAGA
jgi:hypothetical protein